MVSNNPDTGTNIRLEYRLLTGTDDRSFCERVSSALSEGYELYGSPTLAFDGSRIVTGQAIVLRPDYAKAETQ